MVFGVGMGAGLPLACVPATCVRTARVPRAAQRRGGGRREGAVRLGGGGGRGPGRGAVGCVRRVSSSSSSSSSDADSEGDAEAAVAAAAALGSGGGGGGGPKSGLVLAWVGAAVGVALFAGTRLAGESPTLASLAAKSVPLDVALANGKPTLIEFYADWCGVCKGMAPDVAAVEKEFGNSANFVMLNIDNPRWLPEMQAYHVDGVPQFTFLDAAGTSRAESVGKLPGPVLRSGVAQLLEGERRGWVAAARAPDVPSSDEVSTRPADRAGAMARLPSAAADPRAHGPI